MIHRPPVQKYRSKRLQGTVAGHSGMDGVAVIMRYTLRLLQAVQSVLGPQVGRLLSPPEPPTNMHNPLDSSARIGVPVATFPRWMVCPKCHLLAPVDAGFFELKPNSYQPDRTRYVHQNCTGQPTVLPSRFMAGHLDDFSWIHFVHGDTPCNATLQWL